MGKEYVPDGPKFNPRIDAYLKKTWEKLRADRQTYAKAWGEDAELAIFFTDDDGNPRLSATRHADLAQAQPFLEEYEAMFGENGPCLIVSRRWHPVPEAR